MYLFIFLGMSKVDTPSPHASKKQKKCGSCHFFLTDLDPHPDCNKCVPRGCSKENPCSHCAPSPWTHGINGSASSALKGPLRPRRGPRGIQLRGGGNKSGKVCPEVPSTPKAVSPGKLRLAALESGFSSFKTEITSMFASLTGRLTASHPPDSNANGSRLQGGGAHGGIFPSRELEDPLASQRPFTVGPDGYATCGCGHRVRLE